MCYACKPNLYVYASMMESKQGNAGYMYVIYNVYGLSWLCNLYDGRYQCFDTSMATGQVVDS